MELEIGIKYKIVYDDKGFKPVIKEGILTHKEGTLFQLDHKNEGLNTQYIIRFWVIK